MKFRSLVAKGVWLGAVTLESDRALIGALVLKAPITGWIGLKDVDSDDVIYLDLSQIKVGVSYKVVLECCPLT